MRRSRRPAPGARGGFTLVELLVAAALTVALMAILATAFQTGINTLSSLKSVVGLSEQLRSAEAALRRDLTATHLEDETGGAVQVSDPRVIGTAWVSPKRGFFSVRQPSYPMQAYSSSTTTPPYNSSENYSYLLEGNDDSVASFRATDHELSMTVKLSGKTSADVFSADVSSRTVTTPSPTTVLTAGALAVPQLSRTDLDSSANVFVTQWAEVSYFLRPTFVYTSSDNGTTPLRVLTLYRRQRLLSPLPVTLGTRPTAGGSDYREQYPDLSIRTTPAPTTTASSGTPVTSVMNTPADVSNPTNRMNAFTDWRGFSSTGGTVKATGIMLQSGTEEIAAGASQNTPIVYAAGFGTDVLLNNVLSFQVQLMMDAVQTVTTPGPPPSSSSSLLTSGSQYVDPYGSPTGHLPTTYPNNPRTFDTATPTQGTAEGSNQVSVNSQRVRAVRIKLRVYDAKNKQTRQVTIAQDL